MQVLSKLSVLTTTLILLTSLVACGPAKVAVPLPTPDAATSTLCNQLIDGLPNQVVSQDQRQVADDKKLTAAWGNPAITLRCGVGRPSGFTPESSIIAINGVDWFAEQLTAGWRFTSTNTNMYIEVNVPGKYSPEANVLTDLSTALLKFT